MWLTVTSGTSRFSRPWMGDEHIDVASTGAFQVSDAVGEFLLADDGIDVTRRDAEPDTS